jgi:hypothetical protein
MTRWTWACAVPRGQLVHACSRRASSAATSCWCRANWFTCLPTPPPRPRGRMAVIRVMRGTQLGADVLKALLAAAWARGDREGGAQRAAQCGRVLRPAGLRGAGPRLRGSGDCPRRNGSAALKGARPRKSRSRRAPETATIPGLPRPACRSRGPAAFHHVL